MRQIFTSELIELFDRRFESYEAARRANPYGSYPYFRWAEPRQPVAEVDADSARLPVQIQAFVAEIRQVGDRYYVWCPQSTDIIRALIEVYMARARYMLSPHRHRPSMYWMDRAFSLSRYEEGIFELGFFDGDLSLIQAEAERWIELRYPHLLNWTGTMTREQAERHAVQQALEVLRQDACKIQLSPNLKVWCESNGYTEAFYQDGKWWAFPPRGVMPVPVVDAMRLAQSGNSNP